MSMDKGTDLVVAYSDSYLDWQLGTGHPTNPMRAKLSVDLLQSVFDAGAGTMRVIDPKVNGRVEHALLLRVHTSEYVYAVSANGRSGEWNDQDFTLSGTASVMAQGTFALYMRALDRLGRNQPVVPPGVARQCDLGVYFNPQGAKHHAGRDSSSGFCVYNDMAAIAVDASNRGLRTLYIDWDVHHGDGVEDLTFYDTNIMTASIHGEGIFPGTGNVSEPDKHVYNYPLPGGSLTPSLHRALSSILFKAESFKPDMILLAAGADGLDVDPLGNLRYTTMGLAQAGETLGAFAGARDIPVIIGGAGGYTPLNETPVTWAAVVSSLYSAYARASQ